MKLDTFPYARLGLDRNLAETREEMFTRLDEKQADYQAKGWLPAALNLNRGPARGLIELHNFGHFRINQNITKLIPQCFAAYAEGDWLDLHAADVLLFRKPALKAKGQIIFSHEKNQGNLKIPAGRLVRTRPDGLGEIYHFVTTAEVVLPDGALTVSAPVEAESYGQAANVTAGAICEIVTAVAGLNGVANESGWLTSEGADEENDDSLRLRYFLQWKSISGLNKYFYESLALSVPGVSAAKVHDRHPRGQGTVDVYIKGAAGLPTQNLLEAVAQVIEEERPQIDDVMVLGPTPVSSTISALLEITFGGHEVIKAEVENRWRALFTPPKKNAGVNLLNIGEDLTHSRLIAEAMKCAGLKRVLITNPAADLEVPYGGLAVLENLVLESAAAEE